MPGGRHTTFKCKLYLWTGFVQLRAKECIVIPLILVGFWFQSNQWFNRLSDLCDFRSTDTGLYWDLIGISSAWSSPDRAHTSPRQQFSYTCRLISPCSQENHGCGECHETYIHFAKRSFSFLLWNNGHQAACKLTLLTDSIQTNTVHKLHANWNTGGLAWKLTMLTHFICAKRALGSNCGPC